MQVPPVILKFDDTVTLVGSNAAGPEFSTRTYSSVLSNPSSTVPKSSEASESCGVADTVTICRVPPVVTRRIPSMVAPVIVSNTMSSPDFDSAGRPCAPGTAVASAPSSTRRS